jgi:hypothetical protein
VNETDLMFNITRILAKLSLHESMRSGINSDKNNVLNLLDLLNVTARRIFNLSSTTEAANSSQLYALLVRVSFTLGNLTASNERNRILIGKTGGEEIVFLLRSVFEIYVQSCESDSGRANELEEASVIAQLVEKNDH